MQKLKLTLLILVAWSIFTSLYAYYYVVTILALPEGYDAYARNWRFNCWRFLWIRLPFLVMILTVAIVVVFSLPTKTHDQNHSR